MTKLSPRVTADIEGEFVVFLIGVHINRWREVRQWSTVAAAITRMPRELRAHPELGLLHAEGRLVPRGPGGHRVLAFLRAAGGLRAVRDAVHLPAWRAYNRVARTSDAVGIWHETYRVTPGSYEVVYNNMPEVGLIAASGATPPAPRQHLRPADRGPKSGPCPGRSAMR